MAQNKLTHKGFSGSSDVSIEDGCLIGRVLFVEDIITYEGETVNELTANFEAAVDRYLAHCKRTGKPANKPCSGTFNVRVGAELHSAAQQRANSESTSLNAIVSKALEEYLAPDHATSTYRGMTQNLLMEIMNASATSINLTPNEVPVKSSQRAELFEARANVANMITAQEPSYVQ